MARGKARARRTGGTRGTPGQKGQQNKLLQQTEGITPGMQTKVVAVRGPVVPRRELKYIDVASAAYVTDTTGTLTLLNGIAEGDDNTQRSGRQATMKSVALAGFFQISTTGTPQKVRVLLVWDNAANGAAPTIAGILSASTANSFHNVDNQSRFTILWDHTAVLGVWSLVATQSVMDQVIKDVNVVVPLNAVTQFVGTGATIASIGNGSLYLATIGTNAAGTTASSFIGAARVRFLDPE